MLVVAQIWDDTDDHAVADDLSTILICARSGERHHWIVISSLNVLVHPILALSIGLRTASSTSSDLFAFREK